VLLGHCTAIPRDRRITGSAIIHQCEPLTLGVFEPQSEAAVPLEDVAVRDLGFIEALNPPLHSGFTRHAQTRPNDGARAATLAWHRPVEERQISAWTPDGIGIEQVVRAHVALVDAAFDQPHAERLRVEAMILLDGGGYRGQMMNAREVHRVLYRLSRS
jgi:hypothetical protein